MKNKITLSTLLAAAVVVGFIVVQKNYTVDETIPVKAEKKNIVHEEESRTAAWDALQFFSDAAAFPNNDIPADAYVNAMRWYKQNAASNQRTTSTTSWATMGPMNMGGRTIAIAFDPTDTATIWLGSASGGLWKSTTGGIGTSAWSYVPLGFPVLGVSSIAINPANHLEMYVGSGEVYCYGSNSQGIGDIRTTRGSYGMGLFKTINGGSTWTQVINWTYQQNRGIWDIVINPLKPSTVYAATTEGVYKSLDAGTTWNLVLNQKMCMDLEMHEVDTNIILCGVGNNGSTIQGVYRTTNSGASWAANTNGLPATAYQGRITFTKYKNNNDIMYTHICDVYNTVGIYKSIDKGNSWVQQTTQNICSYQGWYTKGLAIKPGNPNNILAGGVYIFQSANAGLSFNQDGNANTYHSDIHDIVVNPSDPNKIYAITDGGLMRSNDFGSTFYECTGGYNTTQHYIGSVSATDTTVLLSGVQDNYTIKYYGSYTWNPVIGGDGAYNAIDHTNDNIQYGAYQYLNVFKDIGQGNNGFYTQILAGPMGANSGATGGNYAAFLAPYLLCYSNTQYIYAGGQALQLSTDGGTTWNYRGSNPVNNGMQIMTIAASFTNTDSIYFATCPDQTHTMKMFFSSNGGTTLTDISSGLPNRYPRRIAINPSNSKEVYVVFSGFGTGHIFKSTNAGVNWADVSTSLPDMPFECITVDPLDPHFVYAGCDYGVFVSSDKGLTWTAYDTGFPDATMVFDLLISPSDRYLYAFTHGRGIYKRSLADLGVGIDEINKPNVVVKIYPNPASDEIHLSISATTNDKYIAYIYSLEGSQVMTSELNGRENTLQVTQLAAASYLVSVRKNGSPFYYGTFIKQ
ncbi:MAG: T9SS type A sorting domain-containing protein [Bacteroidia bacterium]